MDWRGQSEGMCAQHLAKLKSVLVRKEKGDKPKGRSLAALWPRTGCLTDIDARNWELRRMKRVDQGG